jgi:RNA polymerase sigma-70 factor (sigma-E family)
VRDFEDFEDFVTARGDFLVRFAMMLCGDPHRAEDLVQTALARVYPRWGRVSAMDKPEAYLKTVLVHDHLRWWRRRSSSELPVAELREVPTADPSTALAARDAAWRLLGRLPRQQRAVLVLRYYEDLPDTEIAAILRCKPASVRSLASRALATLREALPHLDKEALP